MGILDAIVSKRRDRLSAAQLRTPLQELKARIKDSGQTRDFRAAVTRHGDAIRLIAEIKKASPSKGLIRSDFNHRAIAKIYEQEKVDAISVLTEEDFFQGRLEYLSDVKKDTRQPLLRKDFVIDEYQIYEARAYGADAVLLIAAILEAGQGKDYMCLCHDLGMTALFEVHDRAELETALRIGAPVIGINNRSLKTLAIDLNTALELKKDIPDDRTAVAESGIRTRYDVLKLQSAGLDAMLIGTVLMESPHIAAKLHQLRGK